MLKIISTTALRCVAMRLQLYNGILFTIE